MSKGLYKLPGYKIAEELVNGNIAVEDYVHEVYERISRLDNYLKAYITLRSMDEVVRDVHRAVVEARRSPRKYKLTGLLVAVKDNIHVQGLRTTCASLMLDKYVAVYDATTVERVRRDGGVVVGKTNMDEFAMGSTGETSAYGAARNPWNPERVPGGSSSGTAVALAAGMATVGLGSDTGGSIRLPAAWTGLYGLKPTYGMVSRYGLVAYADSLEQIGPMARNIMDLALLYESMAGFDPRDSTSLNVDPSGYVEAVEQGYNEGGKGVRVALLEDFLEHPGVSDNVKKIVTKVAERLSRQDVIVEPARLGKDLVDYGLPAYYVIAMAEASSNLARYDGVRYGPKEPPRPWESWNEYYSRIRAEKFGREVKIRVMLGSWILSAGYRDQYYVRALRLRRLIKNTLLALLNKYDVLLLPAAVTPPPRLGEVIDDPLKLYALDLATVIANLAGVPALVFPAEWVEGIPLGVQIIGRASVEGEKILFRVAAAHEAESGLRDLVAETSIS